MENLSARIRPDYDVEEFYANSRLGFGPNGSFTRRAWRNACIEAAEAGAEQWNNWQDQITAQEAPNGFVRIHFPVFGNLFGVHAWQDRWELLRCTADFGGLTGEIDFQNYRFPHGATFSGCRLEAANFHGVEFKGGVEFGHGSVSGYCSFHQSRFRGGCLFDSCTFDSFATFGQATFECIAIFGGARFNGGVSLEGSTAKCRLDFGGVFANHNARMWQIEFEDDADFEGFRCGDAASDVGAPQANFRACKFRKNALFGRAAFVGGVDFTSATFEGYANFEGAIFSGISRFGDRTNPNQPANFNLPLGPAIFRSNANFSRAQFQGPAAFEDVQFQGDSIFRTARFENDAWFKGAGFCADGTFEASHFKGTADFRVGSVDQPLSFLGVSPNESFMLESEIFKRTSPEFAERYRALKLIAAKQLSLEAELNFNALELASRAKARDEPWWFRFGESQFARFSDYGRSASRPVLSMVIAYIAFLALVMGTSPIYRAWEELIVSGRTPAEDLRRSLPLNDVSGVSSPQFRITGTRAAIEYASLRTFGVLHSGEEDRMLSRLNIRLWNHPIEPISIRIVSAVYGLFQLLMLFFLALAFRNRFRLK